MSSHRHPLGTIAAIVAVGALMSCTAKAPAELEVVFQWADAPPPSADGLYAFGRILEQPPGQAPVILRSAGPTLLSDGRPLDFPEIPNGDHRLVLIELRESPDAIDRVVYYGVSQPFRLQAGEKSVVPVDLQLTSTPGQTGGSVMIEGSPARLNETTIPLVLITDTGVRAEISNVVGFPADPPEATFSTSLADLPKAEGDFDGDTAVRLDWEVSCSDQDALCERPVYVRFFDARDYPSPDYVVIATIDRRRPLLDAVQVSPARVGRDAVARVDVTFDEFVSAPTLVMKDSNAFTFTLQGDADAKATTWRFEADLTPAELAEQGTPLTDGAYALSLSAVDLAGNPSDTADVVAELVVDGTLPTLVVSPINPPDGITMNVAAREFPGAEVAIRVTSDETLDGPPVVNIGAVPAPCSPEPDELLAWRCAHSVDAIDGEGRKVVQVTAADEALNAVEDRSVAVDYDFTAPAVSFEQAVPGRVGVGRAVEVAVSFTEAIDTSQGPPALRALTPSDCGLDVAFTEVPERREPSDVAPTGFVFVWAAPSEPGEDCLNIPLEVDAVDVAGNPVTVALDTTLSVDRTVPKVVVPVAVQTPSPQFEGFYNSSHRAEDKTIAVSFTVDGALDATVTPSVTIAGYPAFCTSNGWPAFSCTWAYGGTDSQGAPYVEDGVATVAVTLTDAAGNAVIDGSQSVVFDVTGPTYSSQWFYTPSATSPLTEVNALGVNGNARLTLVFDEPMRSVAVSEATLGLALSTEVDGDVPQTFFELATAGGVAAATPPVVGALTPVITGLDVAGNPVDPSAVPADLEVDQEPPPAALVDSPNMVVYRRVPWGSQATSGARDMRVSGGNGAVSSGARVFAYETAAATTPIASATAATDGTFEMTLPPVDRDAVYLAVVDDAGNLSLGADAQTAGALLVRDVTWVGSLRQPADNGGYTNPHGVIAVSALGSAVAQDAALTDAIIGSALADLGVSGAPVTVASGQNWRLWQPSELWPSKRYSAVSVFEPAGGLTYLVNGAPSLADTWLWDGRGWRSVPSGVAYDAQVDPGVPPDSVVADTASDLVRHRVDGESWAWTDQGWVEAPGSVDAGLHAWDSERGLDLSLLLTVNQPIRVFERGQFDAGDCTTDQTTCSVEVPNAYPIGPETRPSPSFGFHPPTGLAVLFGGAGAPSGCLPLAQPFCNDTWLWDGSGWTAHTGSTAPLPRRKAAMLYVPKIEALVLFGGRDADQNPLADTWGFGIWGTPTCDNAVDPCWRDLSPPVSPPARDDAALSLDPLTGDMLLFGGQPCGGAFACDDMWAFDGATWRALTPQPTVPAARADAHAAWDSTHHHGVLFGGEGQDGALLDDLWRWDGLGWSEIAAAGTWPTARTRHAVAYHETLAAFIVFGGDTGGTLSGETWGYANDLWSPLGADDAAPSARVDAGLVYDAASDRLVLHGGEGLSATSGLNDTWEFGPWASCVTAPCWRDISGSATASQESELGFDASTGQVFLLSWEEVLTIPGQRQLRFYELIGQVWEPRCTDAACQATLPAHCTASDDVCPDGRIDHRGGQLVFDAQRQRLVYVTRNAADSKDAAVAWEWVGDRWESLDYAAKPGVVDGPSWVYDARRKSLLRFGGRRVGADAGNLSAETWLLRSNMDRRPGFQATFDFGAATSEAAGRVMALTLRGAAAAVGFEDTAAQFGPWIGAWDGFEGRFADLDEVVTSASSELGVFSWSATTPLEAQRLVAGGKVQARVSGRAAGGRAFEAAQTSLDWLEVEVAYRKGYVATCGDGIITRNETCDDGDTVDSGDGCDAACRAY